MSIFRDKKSEGFQEVIKDLTEMCGNLRKQLDNYEPKVITIKVPTPDTVESMQAGLYDNQTFVFYLHSLENEIIDKFTCDTTGKTDLYQGGLRMLNKIREDLRASVVHLAKKKAHNAKV